MLDEKFMKIKLGPSNPFNLDFTLCCGQTFKWDKHGDWWYGVSAEKAFKVRQDGDELEFENAEADIVRRYFRLDDDLRMIFVQITKDKHVERAVNEFSGLRILRQDPWECLISYICATYKSIPAIKHVLHDLSRKFGLKTCLDGYDLYTFPTPERLTEASVSELMACGLGYRAKYVSKTAKIVCENGFEFESLKRADYDPAKKALMALPGAGPKVADCVLLFSLEKLEAFPVDVWIKRVMLTYYADHFSSEIVKRLSDEESLSNSDYGKLNSFGREYFGKYAGYAQEYLYHYARMQR
jgi:N-glycosylase/DNA lyase